MASKPARRHHHLRRRRRARRKGQTSARTKQLKREAAVDNCPGGRTPGGSRPLLCQRLSRLWDRFSAGARRRETANPLKSQRTRRDSNPRLLPPEPKSPSRIARFSCGSYEGARRHRARRGSFNPLYGTSGPERHRALRAARSGRSECIRPRADPCQVDSRGPWGMRSDPAPVIAISAVRRTMS
jgi:hypothetical protein